MPEPLFDPHSLQGALFPVASLEAHPVPPLQLRLSGALARRGRVDEIVTACITAKEQVVVGLCHCPDAGPLWQGDDDGDSESKGGGSEESTAAASALAAALADEPDGPPGLLELTRRVRVLAHLDALLSAVAALAPGRVRALIEVLAATAAGELL